MNDRCQAPTCNRPLKTEESKQRGMGPVCWGRANPTTPTAPAPAEHPVDPNQIPLPLEEIVTTTEPRVFTSDSPEPEGSPLLQTDDGMFVERNAHGWTVDGNTSYDWNDVTDLGPVRELLSPTPIEELRELVRAAIVEHARDMAEIHCQHDYRGDTGDIVEGLIGTAIVHTTVSWPTP